MVSMLLSISIVFGVVAALILFVMKVGYQIAKVFKFPLNDILTKLGNSAKKGIKNPVKHNDDKPFRLEVFGITIIAEGLRGKLMFSALLTTIASTVGMLINGVTDLAGIGNITDP